MFTVSWIVFFVAVTTSDCISSEHVLLRKSSKIIEFPSSAFLDLSLLPDYTFTVVISKPNLLSQSTSQTVTLIDARPTNNINIVCELNCDSLMNPSFPFVLRANCLRCSEQSYQWSIAVDSKGPVRFLAPHNTNGGLSSAVLKVNPNVFTSAANDLYTINLLGKRYFLVLVSSSVAMCRGWKLHQRLVITYCQCHITN